MQSPKVIISVISDLVTDQRVHKVATTLQHNGYAVRVIGAKRTGSKELINNSYASKRISLIFQKGFFFYAEWNIRLFFYLLFTKANIYVANDLDTLWPNFLITKWKGAKLVYDSHEYFTEQLEIQHRPKVKKVWLWIERHLFPQLKNVYTVNESIAAIYQEQYKVLVKVIRNVPLIKQSIATPPSITLPKDKVILLTQGAGFNADRGLVELIGAMEFLPNDFLLVIIGKGLVWEKIKLQTQNEQYADKVLFIDAVTPQELKQITPYAFCGFSIDKPTCLNYVYSLPNKLFDFIAAGVPVITSNLVEVAKIVETYHIGKVLDQIEPKTIANAVLDLYANKEEYKLYKENCTKAITTLHWGEESKKLLEIYSNLQ